MKKDKKIKKIKNKVKSKKFPTIPSKKEISRELFDSLTSVRFEHNGTIFEIIAGNELLIGGDLHTQVEKIPAIMGYFGSVVAQLEKTLRDKDVLRKRIEARLDKMVRDSGVTGEVRVDRAIRRHSKWTESNLEVNKAREQRDRAKGILKALTAKSISLAVRSADLRAIPSDSILRVSKEDIIDLYGDGDENEREEDLENNFEED